VRRREDFAVWQRPPASQRQRAGGCVSQQAARRHLKADELETVTPKIARGNKNQN
jgi:hypothetical protein